MFRFLPFLLDNFLDIWFQTACPICQVPFRSNKRLECCNPIAYISGSICDKCGLPITEGMKDCGHCLTSNTGAIFKVRSLLWYNDPARKLVHLIKFKGNFEWFDVLLHCLGPYQFPFPTLGFSLVPVPIHNKKFLKRGFNQTEILAERLSERLSMPLSYGLQKKRETLPQSSLSYVDRKSNLSEAFYWKSNNPIPPRAILIDDVFTTGETLRACAKVLRSQGVREILAWTLFRTPEHGLTKNK